MKRTVKWGGPIEAQTLFRCLSAVHLSSYVESPFESRGGLMLVSPPGCMKTSILMAVANSWSNAIPVSDLNTAQLIKMKSAMSSNALRTLILTDMQKIAQRNPNVAVNLLGHLSAIVDEGFTGASWDSNQMIPRTTARCTVMAALTDDYYNRAMEEFVATGFARRFLWAQIRLKDPGVLASAVIYQERLQFSQDIGLPPMPAMGSIPLDVSMEEIRTLETCVQHQIGRHAIAFQLIVKMTAVLRWWYYAMKIETDPLDTIFEFARCLGINTEPSSIIGLTIPSLAADGGGGASDQRALIAAMQLPELPPATIENSNRHFRRRAAAVLKGKLEETTNRKGKK
jgi:hypothetical protein